jgi:HK97 family phage major capsid protein
MKLKLLQETRGGLVKQARELIDAAAAENRGLTADEQSKLASIEGEIDGLSATIDAEVRQLAREANKPVEFTKQEQRDVNQFSLGKIVRHLDRVFRGQPSQIDGIEAEMIEEGVKEARSAGINSDGVALPSMLMRRSIERRANLSVTGGTNQQYGGTLVATEKAGIFGDFYNSSVLEQAGATVLTGLVNNLDLPNYTKGAAPAKRTENQAANDVAGTFASLSLSPNRLAGFAVVSDQLLAQSNENIELIVGSEIRNHMNQVKEIAFFHGGGTNEPTGIAATSGIGSVVGGTNGAAPDWADIVDLETAVAIDDALEGAVRYFTNAKVRGKLKKTVVVGGTSADMVWDRRTPEAPLNGYAASVTNAISSKLTKGSSTEKASAIFFGNAADFYVGYWGGVSLEMTRDSTDAKAGQRHLVANTYYDAGLRRAQSFSAMLDALTA